MTASTSSLSPDAFEKSSLNTDRSPSPRPSVTSFDSDWYLNSRSNRGSRSSGSHRSSLDAPSKTAVTPLHPAVEVSLAILTSGLSVAAFHGIRSISERRASKKLALRKQQDRTTDLSRAESVLVPSTVPEPMVALPTELPVTPATPAPIAELDGSPVDLPPAYSEKSHSTSQKTT